MDDVKIGSVANGVYADCNGAGVANRTPTGVQSHSSHLDECLVPDDANQAANSYTVLDHTILTASGQSE